MNKTDGNVNFYETINIVRKYEILNAIDPYTGKSYDTNEICKLKLIDLKSGIYRVPSNDEYINLNFAIQNGYLEVILINESMESFSEYITYKEFIDEISSTSSINNEENEIENEVLINV